MKRVLIVEDEEGLLEGLSHNFKYEGYEVLTARTGSEGLKMALKQKPDVVVLDIMLPEKDGFTVLKELRQRHRDIPVLVMTARNFEADVLKGFDLGADDYVTKPFGMDELLARLRAALRRGTSGDAPVVKTEDFVVDLAARRVTQRGVAVRLTPTEWNILELLARNSGALVTHEELLTHVWGPAYSGETGYLRVYLAQLRRKLEADPANPRHLLTETGLGYRFQE